MPIIRNLTTDPVGVKDGYQFSSLRSVRESLERLTRLPLASEASSSTTLADLVWKPVVLVEMKKRGQGLQKHYRWAFDC
jgi:hypothetical protein